MSGTVNKLSYQILLKIFLISSEFFKLFLFLRKKLCIVLSSYLIFIFLFGEFVTEMQLISDELVFQQISTEIAKYFAMWCT